MSVLVHGSPGVAHAAKLVDDLIDVCGTKAATAHHDWDSWTAEIRPLEESFQKLLAAAIRNDLELQPHTSAF
ncbi:hypothetical protein AB0H00_27560 [Nocardia sp. NPDC023852]|uniref:hypothetical protein n=1 Tax=Nocardia sp. NPDC023852 TaxID=3154697 RepID=UPI003410F635